MDVDDVDVDVDDGTVYFCLLTCASMLCGISRIGVFLLPTSANESREFSHTQPFSPLFSFPDKEGRSEMKGGSSHSLWIDACPRSRCGDAAPDPSAKVRAEILHQPSRSR